MRSRMFTLAIAAVILAVVVAAIALRGRMRCAGFAGDAVMAADLPPPATPATVRMVSWNLRNFPLDERPEDPDLGYSRRTNICDLEDVLTGLDADIMVLNEVNDTRRFPPILRRSASEERTWRIAFTPRGGRFGQKVAVAWDDGLFELVGEPVVLDDLEVSDGARPAIAVHLVRRDSAFDLTVVGLHLESTSGAWPRRKHQVEALANAVVGLVGRFDDEDLFVAGDFNTSGWRNGTPEQELARVDHILRGAGLTRLENVTGCTAFWDGSQGRDGLFLPTSTDHVYLRGDAFAGASSATSWLHCARLGCDEPLLSAPGAEDGTFFDVSDHCPVVVDVPLVGTS